MQHETRYAKSGDVHVAYQVLGEGPLDLVYVPGFVSHLECAWEYPPLARSFERFASFARLIRFDKRGTGLSDRVSEVPTLEQRMELDGFTREPQGLSPAARTAERHA